MVTNPVTSAFLATIRACSWVAPTDASPIAHVRVGAGPELWIRISDQGDGHWSFGATPGTLALDSTTFVTLFSATGANDDGTFNDSTGARKQLGPISGGAQIDEPPDAPPPVPR